MSSVLWGQCLVLLALFLDSVGASHVFNAYRAIQFDRGDSQRGCRKTYLNANAAVLSDGHIPQKQALVLRIEELTSTVLQKLGSSAGMLLLLPESLSHSARISNTTMNVLRDLENMLLSSTIDVPIYFAVEDNKLTSIYESLKKKVNAQLSPTSDTYNIVVSEKEAESVKQFQVVSMHGVLQGSSAETDVPTFAIVAHYDTLGIAPGYTKGTDNNGSGTIALLELARLFSKLYASAKTKGSHNLIFILGNGGHLNYLGIRQWLQKSPPVLGNIEFALCLEGLGAEQLYLHVSRKPKDDNVKQLYEIFSSTAAHHGIQFDIVHKKINVSHPEMAWEHEAFSYKKVPAATLSSMASPSPLLFRSSPVETRLNSAVLERNIGFISDVLVQYLYPAPMANNSALRGSFAINSKFVASWNSFFGTHPRPDPYLSEDPKAKVPAGLATSLPTLLSKTLQSYLSNVHVDKEIETGKGGLIFYTNIVNTMNVYNTKPVLFDILLFLPIAAYLAAINIYFRGFSQIKELLSTATRSAPAPKRKQ
eukprot:TRINITY_DN552_c1_g1_i1.p2 TRINITY_DN552_c1_g1~~TRINITY_DN552_c1_g1_i1.p2  ORF type:complete len:535 (+),score=84.67 TRINITY_DN552_c1_g1_i1:1869-3473(+)